MTVDDPDAVVAAAADAGINVWRASDSAIQFSVDETTTAGRRARAARAPSSATSAPSALGAEADGAGHRQGPRRAPAGYLEHDVFNTHRSETAMMRYLKYLADKDYALDRGMIPLGSCTMKLNAATEMAAVTWPEFAGHPPVRARGRRRGLPRR